MGILNSRRNEVLRMIIDTFDVTDTLERERDVLEARLFALQRNTPEAILKLSEMDKHVLKVGREKIVGECTYSWSLVEHEIDESTGEHTFTPFEVWRKNITIKDHIPSWCSLDEFYDYFGAELRERYEEACEKAKEG